ncbi:MAG: DNA-3-methyladenine glycosylase I [Deltaproteobacteria bacterium]|nr:DNA-3-methyladenine glycosylase I [Deltaproteobacteria bacterium]
MKQRCAWAGSDPLYVEYHDQEWGVPVHDDRKNFEFLILESAQAGLSWLTVLRKRKNYQKAFCQFNPKKVAQFGKMEVNVLLQNAGIIRNRLKIEAAINNAKRFLEVQKEFGSFTDYCWQFVKGQPIQNRWKHVKQLPAKTAISDAWSQDLKKRGFKFIGSTIMYAHMQAVGMVNDHTTDCFRHKQVV